MKAKRTVRGKKSPAKGRKSAKTTKGRSSVKAKRRSASRGSSAGTKRKVSRPRAKIEPKIKRAPLSELPDREQRLPSALNPGASEGGSEGPELWENAKIERASYTEADQGDWTEEDDEENFPEEYQEWDKRDRRIA